MRLILLPRAVSITWMLLLWLCASSLVQAASTPYYSSKAQDYRTCTTVGVGPLATTTCYGTVDNVGRTSDVDLTNYATMHMPLLLFPVAIRMDMPAVVPKNYRAGVVLGSSTGVSTVGAIVIRTYLKDASGTSQFQESYVVTDAAKAILATTTPGRVEFLAGKPFDQVEIEAGAVLNVAYDINIYYGYGIDANVVTQATGYVSRFNQNTSDYYSTAIQPNGVTVCANSTISNPGNAVDKDLTNYATFGSFVSVNCPTTLQTQLEGKAPAGYQAGFVIGNGGLLDAKALSGLTVTTYLNGVAQESGTGAQLLDLQVLSGDQYAVSFESSKAFDRVEIRQNSLVSALDDLRIYYGFGIEPRAFRDQEPILSNFSAGNNQFQTSQYRTNSLLCVNCGVTNPQNAADSDLKNNYAETTTGVGLGTTTRLKLKLNGPGLAGNTAGVILGAASGLLDASLLSSIRINTYSGDNGQKLVESASGSNLLKLELLADGRQDVSFATTQEFDWVELEVTNTVSALEAMKIFYAFAEDRPTGFPTSIVAPAPLPVELVRFEARASDTAVELTWQTASERNSSHFIVERAVGVSNKQFTSIGRLAAAGSSAQQQEYSLRDADAGKQGATVLYYRLRQVDADGTENYSQVVAVKWKAIAQQVSVFPNPATGAAVVQVSLPEAGAEGGTVMLYNSQGKLVTQHTVARREIVLPVTGLEAGIYQVVVTDSARRRVATQSLVIVTR
ncbi:T9SS type A sorting domain-containing protein [Hymenobacter taeanensis]|uniref:T9SS type A sorting domain-containing protein n=1 Tax=Hymenobacter taeanensis TaxID=2735321 RepID=A0A6M6BEV0_9BACT|nr:MULTISPECIES: T9SS type A sorting domain-containing protein [Hymenobacter]QJX46378.1 T9SS type A sorting domain-containing protein [Hymenobacter taeanensis]UOQ80241.1 T9SS type A sorting domain-containing protein [Hymenobacter sp. 5414T-23]